MKFLHPSPSWHCHKVDTSQVGGEGEGGGPVELASTAQEKLPREDDHTKIPLHQRSSAFKDSLFAFSGALGQYHLLAIYPRKKHHHSHT